MKAFQIKVNGKLQDYMHGHKVDLKNFSKHLESKGYHVKKLWHERRHAVGTLEKNNKKLFLKLATSEGMNKTTEIEFLWNEKFNKENPRNNSNFWVPENIESGHFNNLFYIITDYFEGKLLSERPNPGYEISDFKNYLKELVNFTELIQKLDIQELEPDEQFKNVTHLERQYIKTKTWLDEIPNEITDKYKLHELFKLINNGVYLKKVPRHGDFTPWHIFKLDNNKLLLIDGEHALSNAVEHYDIAYLIQRIFSVLENKKMANELLNILNDRNYDFEKLKVILARRAIGGFLDRSLHEKPNYEKDLDFKELVTNL